MNTEDRPFPVDLPTFNADADNGAQPSTNQGTTTDPTVGKSIIPKPSTSKSNSDTTHDTAEVVINTDSESDDGVTTPQKDKSKSTPSSLFDT